METIVRNCEYLLFTKNDPIEILKNSASSLSIPRKIKIASYIRRAQVAMRKCKKFRDIITSDASVIHTDIGSSFTNYFENKIDEIISINKEEYYKGHKKNMNFVIYRGIFN